MNDNNIDTHKWRSDYKTLCQEIVGMDEFEAERHIQSGGVFDYGYSPLWYITEEIACGLKKGQQ